MRFTHEGVEYRIFFQYFTVDKKGRRVTREKLLEGIANLGKLTGGWPRDRDSAVLTLLTEVTSDLRGLLHPDKRYRQVTRACLVKAKYLPGEKPELVKAAGVFRRPDEQHDRETARVSALKAMIRGERNAAFREAITSAYQNRNQGKPEPSPEKGPTAFAATLAARPITASGRLNNLAVQFAEMLTRIGRLEHLRTITASVECPDTDKPGHELTECPFCFAKAQPQ